MQIVKPKKLSSGDVIGVVAPAFPFPTDTNGDYYRHYLQGVHELENMGFKIKEGKNFRKVQWWRAGTPQERAEDINEMYADSEIKAIIAHDGGNDCIPVLQYIDYDLVKKNPKPFIGFSNMTNIHSALFSKVGMVGFHMGLLTYELGWVWNELHPDCKNSAKEYFHKILISTDTFGEIKPITQWECWRKGNAEGILFGGNLSMLDSLVGTQYFPSLDDLRGSIFFWELDNSPSYRIERVLTHLKYVGLFDIISGMLIGKLVDIKPTALEGFIEPSYRELILNCIADYSFPVIANMDFGHMIPQMPMPVGIRSRMNAETLKLEFLGSAVV